MTFTPILAEDIPPYVLVVVIVPALLVLALYCSMAMAASRRTGRPLQTELIIRLVPVGVVILLCLLVSLLTNRGSASLPSIVIVVIAVVGVLLRVYLRWRMPPKAQTEMKDIPSSSPRPARNFSVLSLPFMVAAWFLFFAFLIFCCVKYLDSSWNQELSILAGVSILCLVLIPVQIIRYFRNKQG
jgi:hypothetical protein